MGFRGQNAESSASYLRRLDAGGSFHGVQLPIWEPCQDDCSPGPPASSNHFVVPKENSAGSFGLSVGVVRHGERADSSFDDWCLSEDAAMYPHDPPLTARGIQQSKKLALALEKLLYAELFQYVWCLCDCLGISFSATKMSVSSRPNSVLQGMDKNEEVSRVVKEVNRESWCFQNSVSPEKGTEANIEGEFVL